jgi:hypothetical protein
MTEEEELAVAAILDAEARVAVAMLVQRARATADKIAAAAPLAAQLRSDLGSPDPRLRV